MLNSTLRKKSARNNQEDPKISEIWNKIHHKHYTEAQKLFAALPAHLSRQYNARLALVSIFKGLKQDTEALNILEQLPEEHKNKLGTIKIHSLILIERKQYTQALKILSNATDQNHIEIMLRKLKCYGKLNDQRRANLILKKITLQDRTNPQVVLQLANYFNEIGEIRMAEEQITRYPHFHYEITLVCALVQIYSSNNQYASILALHSQLPPTISQEASYLFIYIKTLLDFKGDRQNIALYREQASTLLLQLLQHSQLQQDYRKFINLILNHNLNNGQFDEAIDKFITLHPQDYQVRLLSGKYQEQPELLSTILALPNDEVATFRTTIHQCVAKQDFETAILLYQKILANDPQHTEFKTWTNYAATLTNAKQYEASIALHLALLQKNEGYAPLYTGLGYCYNKVNRIADEEQILTQGLKACPHDEKVVLQLGRNLSSQEQYHRMISNFLTFINDNPTLIEPIIQLSHIYNKLGNTKKAKKIIADLLKYYPDHSGVIIAYGKCLIKACDFAEARRFFQIYAKHPLYWSKFSLTHACSLEAEGNYEQALQVLEERCNHENGSVDTYISLIRCHQNAAKWNQTFANVKNTIETALDLYGEHVGLLLTLSFYYRETHQSRLAQKYCEQARILSPSDPQVISLAQQLNPEKKRNDKFSPRIPSSLELTRRALLALQNQDFAKAQQALKILQELYPKARGTYLLAAQYAMRLGDYAQAKLNFQKLENEYSGFTLLERIELANYYVYKQKYHNAISILKELLQSTPYHADILIKLSVCYRKCLDFERATIACQDILKINSHHIEALLMLGRIAEEQADYPLAFQYLLEAERIRPNDLKIAFNKSKLHTQLEQFEKALAVLGVAYQRYPKERKLLLSLFHLHFIQDNLEEAHHFLTLLIKYYPKNQEVMLATIRYKLANEGHLAYPEIEIIFEKLREYYPHNAKIFLDYVFFVNRRSGPKRAIKLLENYLDNQLKQTPRAYNALATFYLTINNQQKAKNCYLDAIQKFPTSSFIHGSYLYFLLFIAPRTSECLIEIEQFYKDCILKFNQNQHAMMAFNQDLHRAKLQDFIVENDVSEENLLCMKMRRLHLQNSPVSEAFLNPGIKILKTLKEAGFKACMIGGAPRLYYMRQHSIPTPHPLRLNDMDIVTNASCQELLKLFNGAFQNPYISHQINFNDSGIAFDVTSIGAQIFDLARYFRSLKGLNIDCIVLDEEGNLIDPTDSAFEGLANQTLDVVSDIESVVEKNAILLFRIIRHNVSLGSQLSDQLNNPSTLEDMAKSLTAECSSTKIMTEISKLLQRGIAYESFNLMLNTKILAHINPCLAECLTDNPQFNAWFFNELFSIDNLMNSQTAYSYINKSYAMAIYLFSDVYSYHSTQQLEYLDEGFIDTLLFQSLGNRQEQPIIKQYLTHFFYLLKYSPSMMPERVLETSISEEDLETSSIEAPMYILDNLANYFYNPLSALPAMPNWFDSVSYYLPGWFGNTQTQNTTQLENTDEILYLENSSSPRYP